METTELPWAITQEKVDETVARIVQKFSPRRVILFGSFARGQSDRNSDLDLLVVMRQEVENPRRESVRIRRELRGISMPMDILVVSESRLQALADAPGLIYREALRNGKVVYESR